MLIKVCGMRSGEQVQKIEGVTDYIGFIFYENSKRFVNTTPVVENALKVGVFVNASSEEINERIAEQSLDAVQLHGHETPEFCSQFAPEISVIKAFGVDDQFEFDSTADYEAHVDFFLFDTKTPHHGGSGQQYDWSILSNYKGAIPFFLSGGIRPSSVHALKNFQHPKFAGIDLNSGFEQSPGDKNTSELIQFIEQIKN
ncbi:MAG: phosphoribosylanthranilate isomerase [Crocinitomicaceae bacterium]|nr:phosphoribosylanthranilate isomerase [Flavobacteriales bacterium]NQZ34458.1 phosphoribosylanthranilate isomerase [Crocinitomicaceae bacterium]